MKLSDYQTPLCDAREQSNGSVLCGSANLDLARDLERKLRKCRNVLAGIADGFELCGKMERTSVMILKTLEETK